MADAAARQKVLLVILIIVGLVAAALIAYNVNRFMNPPTGVVGGALPAEEAEAAPADGGDPIQRGGPIVAPN